nr:low expression of osmotically responsive genes 2 [Tanacetum cinerariifolium]
MQPWRGMAPVSWRGNHNHIVVAAMAETEYYSPLQPPQAHPRLTRVIVAAKIGSILASYCALIQGLSLNVDIPAYADNDLPWPYATSRWRPLKGTLWHRCSQHNIQHFREHYAKMTPEIGVHVQIVGDDLIVTNPKRTSVTSKSIEDVRMSKRIGWGVMASHRRGETEDTFICKYKKVHPMGRFYSF